MYWIIFNKKLNWGTLSPVINAVKQFQNQFLSLSTNSFKAKKCANVPIQINTYINVI